MSKRPLKKRPLLTGGGRSDLEKKEQATALAIFAVLAVAIVGFVAYSVLNRPPATDPKTGCPTSAQLPAEHTLLLIDQTDPLTRAQGTYAKTLIWREYLRLKPGGRLTVRGITEDPDAAGYEFVRCRIETGDEAQGKLDQNAQFVEDDFKKTVGEPLDAYINSLLTVPRATSSPIEETLVSVMDEDDFDPKVASRRLVVMSDMAQNSPNVSQYPTVRGGKPNAPLPDLSFRKRFKGVQVRIHYVERRELGWQGEAHEETWKQFFTRLGATNVAIGWGYDLGEVNG
jgi:hypothetical protein